MKKVIGVVLLLTLVTAVYSGAQKAPETEDIIEESEEPEEIVEIVETEPVHYLTDSELSKLYTCKQDVRTESDSVISLDLDIANVLMKVARSEGGPNVEGQLWVMRAIYNRYEEGWDDSIWKILNTEDQFTVVTNGTYKKAEINAESHIALALLESGYNPTEGATYWESNTNSPDSWHKRNLEFIKEVDGNLFYKEKLK